MPASQAAKIYTASDAESGNGRSRASSLPVWIVLAMIVLANATVAVVAFLDL